MKIGEVAKQTGLSVPTLRYYEAEGVLPRHGRTESGYRVFGQEDVERIQFIKKAKRLGLSLGEIRDIFAVQAARQPTCIHVRALLETKLDEVKRALAELEQFQTYLVLLLDEASALNDCRPSGGRICSIIEESSISESPAILEKLRTAR